MFLIFFCLRQQTRAVIISSVKPAKLQIVDMMTVIECVGEKDDDVDGITGSSCAVFIVVGKFSVPLE